MQTIYCISGIGADEGAFQYLDLSFAKPVFVKWIKPIKNETLPHYANRLQATFIHDTNPLILGLSLGGMIAVEIAKKFPASKTVIISSAKTKNEIPFYWKAFKHLPLYEILPEWSIRKYSPMRNYFLGVKQQAAKEYVIEVARHADVNFYRWATGAIIKWQNEIVPSNVTHIHGTGDNLLPYKYVQADITVKNGTHLMIMQNANEISGWVKNIFASAAVA